MDGIGTWLQRLRWLRRRTWVGSDRLHLECRALPPGACEAFGRAVAEELGALDGVRWARHNRPLERVVVAYAGAPIDVDAVIERLEAIEARLGLEAHPFPADPREHPGDLEPLARTLVEGGADLAWLAIGQALRASGVGRLPFHLDLAATTALFRETPRLRRLLEERLGGEMTDWLLGLLSPATQGLSHGWSGPLVDVAHRALRARELAARRAEWARWEPTLCGHPDAHGDCDAPTPRPRPLPGGAVEDYAEQALLVALGAFGFGLAASGDTRAATAPVFGGVPKPARLGREAFVAELGTWLAREGVAVLRGQALRLLDRVDCLLVSEEVLRGPGGEDGGRDPAADALAAAARAAGLRRVLASDAPAAVAWFDAEAVVPDGPRLAKRVRALQAEGRVVCLVARGPQAALAAADVALAIAAPGAPRADPPWGADLLVPDLQRACGVVAATGLARGASLQSVRLAEVEAAAGLLLCLRGLEPRTTRAIQLLADVAAAIALGNGVRKARAVRRRVPPPTDRTPWHVLTSDEALARARSGPGGLSDAEAAERRVEPTAPPRRWAALGRAVLEELDSPLVPVLSLGASLAAFTGSLVDAGLILSVLAVNGALGGAQRYRVQEALRRLERGERVRVRVRRDGAAREVDPDEVVRGDVLELSAGDMVPADCRLLEAQNLEVDESSLTGESLPVAKEPAPSSAPALAERTSMLYAGTAVVTGSAVAMAVAVGEDVEALRGLGTDQTPPPTGVEARLDALTQSTIPLAAAAGALLVLTGVGRGRGHDALTAGISLAMAAVPEGLPLLATTAQLAAAERLAGRGVLVQNPRAIEALGRVDVICLDKTGTLTEGTLRLQRVSDGREAGALDALSPGQRRALAVALRATPACDDLRELHHGTDRALVEGARRAGVREDEGLQRWERLDELPFASDRGYHAVVARAEGRTTLSLKGAAEVLLPRCVRWRLEGEERAVDEAGRAALREQASRLARGGYRVLAVADRELAERPSGDDLDGGLEALTFHGFVAFSDPVREAARAAIADLRRAGVEPIMVTGDHPETAVAIAREVGITADEEALTGVELDALDEAGLAARLETARVVARVTPAQKVRIVQALQRAGRVVAMTGDGANDAHAIRLADAGIALGDAAKASARRAADAVVTDERIETIVAAVLEGRALWASVREAVAILVGGNLGEIGFTLVGALQSGRPPLNARQLMLVNLLTDALPAMAIALRPPPTRRPEQLLHEGPEASLGRALHRDVLLRAFLTGGAAWGAWTAARFTGTRRGADTVALLALVGAQLGQTLVVGGRNRATVAASLGSAAALLAVVQIPGLSHFFGCRPLGPLGLLQAGAATAAATGAAALAPTLLARAQRWSETSPTLRRLSESALVRAVRDARWAGRLRQRWSEAQAPQAPAGEPVGARAGG